MDWFSVGIQKKLDCEAKILNQKKQRQSGPFLYSSETSIIAALSYYCNICLAAVRDRATILRLPSSPHRLPGNTRSCPPLSGVGLAASVARNLANTASAPPHLKHPYLLVNEPSADQTSVRRGTTSERPSFCYDS
jgi:hypothetical protein